jgi:myo-inositol-1(or 4)-monophosphatase
MASALSDSELQLRYEAACAVAREAGALARRRFKARVPGTYTLKGYQNFLTETDGEVERLIVDRLTAAFPSDTFIGEEGGGSASARVWVIDPIDGTANFARGLNLWAISIAFVQDNRVAIGAIYEPMADELFAAKRGAGATLNGTKLSVSAVTDIREAMTEIGWSPRLPIPDYLALLTRVMASGAGARSRGSAALGLAYVAAGRSDAYGELHCQAWDVLAGLILVEEAGGWCNDFLANDGLTSGNQVLACTPAIKDALVKATGFRG